MKEDGTPRPRPATVFIQLERKEKGPLCAALTGGGRRRIGGVRRSLVGSEVPRELALFTAVEEGVVEEGAGGAAPLRPLVLLLVGHGLHNLTARVCGREERTGRDR